MQRGTAGRSQVVVVSAYFGRLLLALGVTAYLGRTLDAEDFGFFATVGTVFFLCNAVLDLGTGVVGLREIAKDRGRERVVLEGLLAWRWAVGVGLTVLIWIFAFIEPAGPRRTVLLLVGCAIPFLSQMALLPFFQVRQAQEGPAVGGVLVHGASLLALMGMGALKIAGPFFAVVLAVREIVNALWIRGLALRGLGYRPKPRWRGRGLGPFFRQSFVNGAAMVAQAFYFHADVFIVRAMRGEAELGAYALAFRPLNALLSLPGVVMLPVVPLLTMAGKDSLARLANVVRRVSAPLFGIGALMASLGVALAPDLLEVLYAEGTHKTPESAVALAYLSAALGCAFLAAPFISAVLAHGGERALLWIGVLGLLFNIVSNVLVVPTFGFTGAAATTALTEVLVCAVLVRTFRRRVGAFGLTPSHLVMLGPAMLAYLLLMLPIEAPALARVALGIALGAAGGLWILRSAPGKRFLSEVGTAPVDSSAE